MKKAIRFFTNLCEAYMPDAFVFCLGLTLIVFGLGLSLTHHGPLDLVGFWGKEFWSLNGFAMQMVFVLISGHMLATTPLVQRFLGWLSGLAKTEGQGLVLLSLFSTLSCFINWGMGLIVSGILAVELARKLGRVNFGLFVATAYSGFLVWHGGLSGSIPLKIAGSDEILRQVYPETSIPLSETIFSHWNLLIVAVLVILLPVVALLMRTEEKTEVVITEVSPLREGREPGNSVRDRLETSPVLHWIFFIFFLLVMFDVIRKGEAVDINRVNFIFLSLALFLHQTPRRFLDSLQRSISFSSGIVIQFPFYAGMMGLMQHSGLADIISGAFVSVAGQGTLALLSFVSGGIVNFFIPSGGGQWVVQGPVMLKAGKTLGVDPAKISMAVAWGDSWTNMIQPFWTLPLLSLAKLKLGDIMGYCLVYLVISGIVISLVFSFL